MIAWLALACGVAEDRSSETCGGCHPAELEAWQRTGHARGVDGEVLAAWLPEVREAWGEGAERRCVACHAPGWADEPDVGCVACHGAIGNLGEADGALIVDERGPIGARGVVDAPHGVEPRGFLLSSSLCATCHEVTGPRLLDERTGSEHAVSGRVEGCADCHLPDGDHDLRPRWEDALALTVRREGGDAVVTVSNVGAGHAIPTGAAFLRDLRVDLVVDGVAERVLTLVPVPVADGVPVALPTDADGFEGEALQAGETRTARVGLPEDADRIEAIAVFRRFRPEVLEALGVLVEDDEQVVAHAVP
ncbi:MAG: hypothetical protein H6735_22870 [Alphaproteobacteria bacterium]|nr:hypothetical protein [Alphaproteobacteria bacterium]